MPARRLSFMLIPPYPGLLAAKAEFKTTPLYKKHRTDFSFALLCSFWVWPATLASRFAVDTRTCSTSLSQARYAMPRVCFKVMAKFKHPRFRHWISVVELRLSIGYNVQLRLVLNQEYRHIERDLWQRKKMKRLHSPCLLQRTAASLS